MWRTCVEKPPEEQDMYCRDLAQGHNNTKSPGTWKHQRCGWKGKNESERERERKNIVIGWTMRKPSDRGTHSTVNTPPGWVWAEGEPADMGGSGGHIGFPPKYNSAEHFKPTHITHYVALHRFRQREKEREKTENGCIFEPSSLGKERKGEKIV